MAYDASQVERKENVNSPANILPILKYLSESAGIKPSIQYDAESGFLGAVQLRELCQNAPDNSQFATRIKTSRIPTCYYKACGRVRALLLLLTFFYFFFSFLFFLLSFFKASCSVYSLESVLSEALVDRVGLQRGWLTCSGLICATGPELEHLLSGCTAHRTHPTPSVSPPACSVASHRLRSRAGVQGSSNAKKDGTGGCFHASSF